MLKHAHSQTYIKGSFRNLPHINRLNFILNYISNLKLSGIVRYADFGCSDGYITNEICKITNTKMADGYDYNKEILERNEKLFINFQEINLNTEIPLLASKAYDLVTSFETLEHVGDVRIAIKNIISSVKPGGRLIITVPIETGLNGIFKFVVKQVFYNDDDSEIFNNNLDRLKYLWMLLLNRRLEGFRKEKKSGWANHYGFDYRLICDELNKYSLIYDRLTIKRNFSTILFDVTLRKQNSQ